MNIVICGAGHVGSYAAEILGGAGHNITVIDTDSERLRFIEETMDVRTMRGNCAEALVLSEAGSSEAELVVAATDSDEVNLLSATIAKGVGARKTVARVHHRAYFEQRGLNYSEHLAIDRMICPEYSAALAIARTLRNPGAIAIENFARGQIEMQEFRVSGGAPAVGKPLSQVAMTKGARLLAVSRNRYVFLPDANTAIKPNDIVILAGDKDHFQEARRLFHDEKMKRRDIVIMGGPALAVWLCRALQDKNFSIRLFETNRMRAEELADKLPWITVIQADPTDRSVFEEEHIYDADAFVALTDDDEHNILGGAWAKSMGCQEAIVVVQRPNYLHLLEHVGIDHRFSPRRVAVTEIERLLEDKPLRYMASLAEGILDVFQVNVGDRFQFLDTPLRDIKTTPHWIIAAIKHGPNITVPGAEDRIRTGDTLLVAGQHGMEAKLREIFAIE